MVCLAATNVNWRFSGATALVDNYLGMIFGNAKLATSSNGLQSTITYEAGGTMMEVLGKWSGRKLTLGMMTSEASHGFV